MDIYQTPCMKSESHNTLLTWLGCILWSMTATDESGIDHRVGNYLLCWRRHLPHALDKIEWRDQTHNVLWPGFLSSAGLEQPRLGRWGAQRRKERCFEEWTSCWLLQEQLCNHSPLNTKTRTRADILNMRTQLLLHAGWLLQSVRSPAWEFRIDAV